MVRANTQTRLAPQIWLTLPSKHMLTILATDQSHFLRVLVADIVRELLVKGADRAVFMKSGLEKSVESFPVSQIVDSKWMSEITEYFTKIDSPSPLLEECANCSTW